MKKTAVCASLITVGLFSVAGMAWGADSFSARYTYLRPSNGDFKDKVDQQEFRISGTLPIQDLQDSDVGLSLGGVFQANLWNFDNSNLDDLDLYKILIPVSGTFMASDKIPVTVTLVPGLHSDLQNISPDDMRLEGSVSGVYPYSDTVKIVLGAAYGEEFGDPKVFPIGGVSWKVSDALQADLVFPSPKISYALSQDLRVYLAGEPAGGQWNVDVGDRSLDVLQEGYRVGLGAEYQVVEDGWLFAAVGNESNRKVSVAVNDSKVVNEKDIDDATFVQVGFRLQ